MSRETITADLMALCVKKPTDYDPRARKRIADELTRLWAIEDAAREVEMWTQAERMFMPNMGDTMSNVWEQQRIADMELRYALIPDEEIRDATKYAIGVIQSLTPDDEVQEAIRGLQRICDGRVSASDAVTDSEYAIEVIQSLSPRAETP